MNNDIKGDIKYLSAHNAKRQAPQENNQVSQGINFTGDTKSMQDSLEFLDAMGCAKVNMDRIATNSVQSSTAEFLSNSALVEAKVLFCDELIEQGCDLKKAMYITEQVFGTLENEYEDRMEEE